MWKTILDDERQKGWANAAGSTAEIVVPIRQVLIDHLLSRVAWPRMVEQLYVRPADDNRFELMVVASMFGFRKRFDAVLRLDPVFDRRENTRVTLTIENPGLITSALAMAGSALTLPRGVSIQGGRIILDPDELARSADFGDLIAHLTRAEFAVREGVLWVTAALDIVAGSERPAVLTPPSTTAASTPSAQPIDTTDVPSLFVGAHATFTLRLAEALVNRLMTSGLSVWRARTDVFALALPKGTDIRIEKLALEFEHGWLIVKGWAGYIQDGTNDPAPTRDGAEARQTTDRRAEQP